ncbi:MAG: glycosyltransferase family 1 protein [Caldilineaceae bacterium]
MKVIGIDASRAGCFQRTGTERYALEIIRHLLALPDAAKYQWRLYVDAPPGDTFSSGGLCDEAVTIRILPRHRLWTHRVLAREIRHDPPDLLFVPAHVIPFTPMALLGQHSGVPAVVTIHDLGYHYFPQAHSRFQRYYLPVSTRWSAWVATEIIAVSQATASDLQRFYGVNAGKITVVHEAPTPLAEDALSTGLIDQRAGNAVRAQYQLPICYGLYVGTLQPRKNLSRLLQAYTQLRQRELVSWSLVLVGAAGRQSELLKELADTLQIAADVHFLGYLSEAELVALYRGAHLFVFPSLFEGFGLPVLEAQSHGVPVMSANNSSIPEIAGDAALLVDPTDIDAIADAMLRLSEDEALRQQLIAAGYENVKRFSWEKAARETLAVFEKVLGKR